ncbi:hypothetical protein [Spirillospora sp. CA-294931]|uniref:hypothetical protein n=1 Tax=Spirillospora sp. CA-294931 TaxID=3240042 RepID=UPI003D8A1E92
MPIAGSRTRAAAALAAALMLAACSDGGSPRDQGATPTATPSATRPLASPSPATRAPAATPAPQPSAVTALVKCMRRHGIPIAPNGTPSSPPPGYDPRKAQGVLRSCLRNLSAAPEPTR